MPSEEAADSSRAVPPLSVCDASATGDRCPTTDVRVRSPVVVSVNLGAAAPSSAAVNDTGAASEPPSPSRPGVATSASSGRMCRDSSRSPAASEPAMRSPASSAIDAPSPSVSAPPISPSERASSPTSYTSSGTGDATAFLRPLSRSKNPIRRDTPSGAEPVRSLWRNDADPPTLDRVPLVLPSPILTTENDTSSDLTDAVSSPDSSSMPLKSRSS
mmetsp:Transcript_9263/g.32642  ORF Transcript_9263/g.32642 Transcript_9263/m.32642 type:complete len:216 (-) Transcript_9263:435-1082(-)